MSGPNLDLAKMARDPKGRVLLRRTFESFIPQWFPELTKEEIKKKIEDLLKTGDVEDN